MSKNVMGTPMPHAKARIAGHKVIFVDYFDTLVLRHVTPSDLTARWAKCLRDKYPDISDEVVDALPAVRSEAFNNLRADALYRGLERTEITYEDALGEVYRNCERYLGDTSKDSFIGASKAIDFALECGCQYANRRLIGLLQSEKDAGKRIYCVSDYYLPKEMMKQLMIAANVPDGLIDDIFVSCDVGKRKAVGDMYPYVLRCLGLKADDVVMIGDNDNADYQKAIENGIDAVLRPRLVHKVFIHARSRAGVPFSSRQMKRSMRDSFLHGPSYGEYIAIFYVFTQRLYDTLRKEGIKSIAFMAREGHYLQELFHTYQELKVTDGDEVSSSYFWCSRRSIMAGIAEGVMPEYLHSDMSLKNWLKSLQIPVSAARRYAKFDDDDLDRVCDLPSSAAYRALMGNEGFSALVERTIDDNRRAFLLYTEPYLADGTFRFVDSGWKCTSQNAIQKWYGIPTKGYYIGVQIPDEPIEQLDREGLVFCETDPRSRYYDYLGMNIPFYQQLLAAPHGTALKYVVTDDGVDVLSEWDPMEEELYKNYIERLQTYMSLIFRGLCVWDDASPWDDRKDWFIAKLSMHSSLFANRMRRKFIRMCTDNYVQNFRQENRGKVQYDPSKVRLGVDIIWKPEKYLRYVAKVQRTSLYDNAAVRVLYPVISRLFYMYCLLLRQLKNLRRDGKLGDAR
jgi:FMN phosphatase YigB (HAD superfamily)